MFCMLFVFPKDSPRQILWCKTLTLDAMHCGLKCRDISIFKTKGRKSDSNIAFHGIVWSYKLVLTTKWLVLTYQIYLVSEKEKPALFCLWTPTHVHQPMLLRQNITNVTKVQQQQKQKANHEDRSKMEPCHEIIVLFVLRKLILQTRMLRLDVWFLVGPFVYFHTFCVRTAWAFAGRLYDKYHNLMSWLNYYSALP